MNGLPFGDMSEEKGKDDGDEEGDSGHLTWQSSPLWYQWATKDLPLSTSTVATGDCLLWELCAE